MEKIVNYDKFVKNLNNFENMIIYGKNNCGKTYLLKTITKEILNNNIKNLYKNDNNKVIDITYPFLIDVERIGKNETQHVKSILKIDFTSEYFDDKKNKLNNDEQLNNYESIRQWIIDNNANQIIEVYLKKIFSNDHEYLFSDYNLYSDGVKNIINVISSLYYINYNINEINNKVKVIILIDEIELYLHISLQTNFVNFLLTTFNNFKFIFTSHSPLLMQRIDNCKIYILDDNHKNLILEESQYFFSCDDIMEKSFGVNKYPDQLLDFIHYLDKCKTNPNKFKINKYKELLCACRGKHYNFNMLINNVILEFIEFQKHNKSVKKGSEIYNAIHS